MKSIIHSLEESARLQPDELLYAFLNGTGEVVDSYTYRSFHERTNYMAAALQHSGVVRHNEPVLLVYPPGLEFIVAFVACAKLGALAVPVPSLDSSAPSGAFEKLVAIAGDCGAKVALTTQAHLDHVRRTAARNAEAARWLSPDALAAIDWFPTDAIQGAQSDFALSLGQLFFLQYTSGSTQAPRGVMVSHANVVDNGFATVDHRAIAVSWLPHYHDMGLIGYYLYPMLMRGMSYTFSNAYFLKRPRLWFDVITRYRGTITSAPNFAFEYCLREDKIPSSVLDEIDLSSLRCLMNASEPVRATTYERFLNRFQPCGLSRKAFVVYYGLAESTLCVTGGGRIRISANTKLLELGRLQLEMPRPESSGANEQTRLVSCGAPITGVDVCIVDNATGAALGEDLIGEVWVAGDSKAQGYWNKHDLSHAVFNASTQYPSRTTYLRTGDLGFMHDGELFVCGRLKDMIIIGGRNHYANDIEAAVEDASDKVRQGFVAAFAVHRPEGEAVVVLLEARRANDLPDLEAIGRELRKRCQLELDVLAVVPHGSIAKTSSGKIARQECRTRWLDGRIPAVARRDRAHQTAARDSMHEFLVELAAAGSDTATLADLGMDSLTLVEISRYLESIAKQRGIDARELSDLRFLQAVTVGEVKAFLSQAAEIKPFSLRARAAYFKRIHAIDREESARMRRDARLPAEIRAAGPPMAAGNKILLTGATGFVGSFLLEALLRLTNFQIVAVVRAEDNAHARRRVESALQRTGIWNENGRDVCAHRVQAVPGDISKPRFAMDMDAWEGLTRELSAVYHCGAEVDYVKPYAALRGSNFSSVVEALRLVTTGTPKILNYVSTTFVFGFTARQVCLESDCNAEMSGLNFGYTQTKWVSEQLVHAAIERGIAARVFRPSFVTASLNGRYVRRDLLARVFAYMIRHQVAPDSENQISCLPVDVCANNIAAISLLGDLAPGTFHLTADEYYSMRNFCESIERQYGYRFEYMSLESIIGHVNRHCRRDDPLFPLVAFFNHNLRRIVAMREKRYANHSYRRVRALSGACLPEPELDAIAGAVVRFLQNERMVAAPPKAIVAAASPVPGISRAAVQA
jgi:thioester reductase-like protein